VRVAKVDGEFKAFFASPEELAASELI